LVKNGAFVTTFFERWTCKDYTYMYIYIYISWYHTISAIVIAYTIPFPFFLLVGCWTNFQAKRAGEAGTAFERIQLVNAMMTPQVFTSLIIGVDVKAIII